MRFKSKISVEDRILGAEYKPSDAVEELFISEVRRLFDYTVAIVSSSDFETICNEYNLQSTVTDEDHGEYSHRFEYFKYQDLFNAAIYGSRSQQLSSWIIRDAAENIDIRNNTINFRNLNCDLRFLHRLTGNIDIREIWRSPKENDNRKVRDFVQYILNDSCNILFINPEYSVIESSYSDEHKCQVLEIPFPDAPVRAILSSVHSRTTYRFNMFGRDIGPYVILRAGDIRYQPTPFGVVCYNMKKPRIFEGLEKIYHDYSSE